MATILAGLLVPAMVIQFGTAATAQTTPATPTQTPTAKVCAAWGVVQGQSVAYLCHDFSALPMGETVTVSIPVAFFSDKDAYQSLEVTSMRKGPAWWWFRVSLPQFSLRREAMPYPSGSCLVIDGDAECNGLEFKVFYKKEIEIGWLDLSQDGGLPRWPRRDLHPTFAAEDLRGVVDPQPPLGSKVTYGVTEKIGNQYVTGIALIETPSAQTKVFLGAIMVDCRGACPLTP